MSRKIKIVLVVALILALGLLISACGGARNQPASSPSESKAAAPANQVAKQEAPAKQEPQKTEKVALSYTARTYAFLPIQVAIAKGFFREQGLEMEAVQMKSNVGMAALESGDTGYTMTFGSTIESIIKGLPFRLVGVITAKPLHFLVAQPEITSVNQLKDKVIGTVRVGGSDEIAVRAEIRGKGGDDSGLKSVGIGDAPLLAEALRQKIIDLAPLVPPWPAQLQKEGFNILTGPKDLTHDQPLAGITTQTKLIKENPEQVKKVLRAMLKTLQYMRQDKEGTVAIMVEWLGEDKETARGSYDLILDSYSKNGEISSQDMEEIIAERKKAADLESKPGGFNDVVDFTLLHEVQKELKL